MVVYGHTPVPEPEWLNRTINIDTGCVFGGKLTALRYPEREFVSVPAARTYCEPARPFLPEEQQAPALTAQQVHDDLLDAEDVLGKRIISTRLRGNVTIREENATAALEVMSRFAANPKWLIYLPPTMSPCETSSEPGLLEHPAEAFAYYRSQGVPQVVCEEKHMGSRAVVIVCRDEQAARERFGVVEGEIGIVYTRTGRRFFNEPALETQFLDRVRAALTAADFWDEFDTNWACLDCELMPWSAKAQELLRLSTQRWGPQAGHRCHGRSLRWQQAAERLSGEDEDKVEQVMAECRRREEHIGKFVAAYRQYCWPVASLDDLKLAPFHLLATEGQVHTDKNHVWHMDTLATICRDDPELLLATPYKVVDVTDPASQAAGSRLVDRTDGAGRRGHGGQAARLHPPRQAGPGAAGREVPGPGVPADHLRPRLHDAENLTRLRSRGLGHKRSLALREFALGIEGLERFVRREPLRRVHECVFGVLALESEPVDPRL